MADLFFGTGSIVAVQATFGADLLLLFAFMSQLGSTAAILTVAAYALWTRGHALAIGIVVAAAVAGLVVSLVWTFVPVARPNGPEIFVYREIPAPSFPSGHTATLVVLWGLLALAGAIPWLISGLIILIGMVSRLYLGAHYLGDVVAGLLLGLAVLVLYRRVWPPLFARLTRLPYWLYVAGGSLAVVAALGAIPWVIDHPTADFWQTIGLVVGAVPAALAERRWIGYEPDRVSMPAPLRAVVGLGGLVALLVVGIALSGAQLMGFVIALLAALAALWAFALAPALFCRIAPASATSSCLRHRCGDATRSA